MLPFSRTARKSSLRLSVSPCSRASKSGVCVASFRDGRAEVRHAPVATTTSRHPQAERDVDLETREPHVPPLNPISLPHTQEQGLTAHLELSKSQTECRLLSWVVEGNLRTHVCQLDLLAHDREQAGGQASAMKTTFQPANVSTPAGCWRHAALPVVPCCELCVDAVARDDGPNYEVVRGS